MKREDILSLNEMSEISAFLMENGYSRKSMTITIDVEDKETLNRINYDIYYRNGGFGNDYFDSDVDEIDIEIGGIKFKYCVSGENNN